MRRRDGANRDSLPRGDHRILAEGSTRSRAWWEAEKAGIVNGFYVFRTGFQRQKYWRARGTRAWTVQVKIPVTQRVQATNSLTPQASP